MAVTSPATESPGSLTRFKSQWVKDRAKQLGFERQQDLADAAGISRQQLNNILNGKWLPSTPTANSLAKALKCSADDLTELVQS